MTILWNCICLTTFILFYSLRVRFQNHFSDCNHITYSSTVTSAEFRWFARWHTEYLDQRFWLSRHFSQLLWLSEPELESVLQPDLHLSGNVATKRPRDLRKPDNKLHQGNNRADEKELPQLYGGEGTHNFTHEGFAPTLDLGWSSLFRMWPITTPMRRTLPL